ncbi:MAG: choice-of-anchor Q domain-containing protein, partial [Rubripirellula sp.]
TASRAGGGIETNAGSVSLTDVILDNNTAGPAGAANRGNGGGLHITGNGDATISGGTVNGNLAALEGGGLWNGSGTMTISGTTISGNTASGDAADEGGGGIYNNDGTLTVSGATISTNVASGASGSGGGILNLGGTVDVTSTSITGNVSNRAGGGIEATADSTTTLTDVNLDSNVTGPSGSAAPGNGGGLHITGDGDATISGGTVNGNLAAREGGGLWNGSGTMTISGTTISGNTASGDAADDGGGGIFNNGGTLAVSGATVDSNVADGTAGSGGGVLNLGGTVTITDTVITSNTANRAGGGIESADGSVDLTNVTLGTSTGGNSVVEDAAPGNGGGLHIGGAGVVTISGGTVVGNAAVEGGGLWNSPSGSLTVAGTTISDNTAVRGGGIYSEDGDGTLSLDAVTVTMNAATGSAATDGGGGVYNLATTTVGNSFITDNVANGSSGSGGGFFNGSSLTVTDTEISGNTANRAGGGIEAVAGSSTELIGVTLSKNVAGPAETAAPGNGGGVHITGDGVLSLTETTVSGNDAANEGGGLWNSASGSIDVIRSTVSSNTSGDGGGIFNDGDAGNVSVTNSTIASNVATGLGGGIASEGGSVTLVSVTVADNSATSGGGVSFGGGTVAATNSIVSRNTATNDDDVSGALSDSGNNLVGVDAGLATLADNGGPTQTIALLANSAALDAGTTAGLTTDQRGISRPQGPAADIGAFESDLAAPVVPSLSVTATDAVKNEGNAGITAFTFTVTRNENTTGVTTVDFALTGSGVNAASANDFDNGDLPSGTVSFADGESSQTITVNVMGDTDAESDESFVVTLSNASGTAAVATPSATGTIQNDDVAMVPTFSLSSTSVSQLEGDAGTTTLTFTVARSGNTTVAASVDFAVTGVGANPADADDFGGTLPSGTVDFASGETTRTISIIVSGDNVIEQDELFAVTLSNPSGDGTLSNPTVQAEIRDDDFAERETRIFVPDLVARLHVIPGDSVPSAIIFQAVSDTIISVTPVRFASVGEVIRILDGNTNPISSFADGVTTATIDAGDLYSIIFEPQTTDRIYSVRSSNGESALSNRASTNIFEPTDTNASGETTALDALVVINELDREGDAEGEQVQSPLGTFLDVNRDDRVSALDALLVINHLARQSVSIGGSTAEGERTALVQPSVVADLAADLAADAADEAFQDDVFDIAEGPMLLLDIATDPFASSPRFGSAVASQNVDVAMEEFDLTETAESLESEIELLSWSSK